MKPSICLTLIAALCMTTTSHAAVIFQENFDSLTAGSSIVGQGGWSSNNSGVGSAIVSSTLTAYSPANYLDLYAGGTVQNSFTPASLSAANTNFSFYFMPGANTAGHNLQISLRSSTGYAFYLNLRGNLTSVDVGLDANTTTNYVLGSALAIGSWYQFDGTINAATNQLAFTLTPSTGGAAVLSQSITLSASSIQRLVVGSSSSTASGDWSLDSITLNAVPEANSAALTLIGGGLIALGGIRALKKDNSAKQN